MNIVRLFLGSIVAALVLTLVGCAPKGSSIDARVAFAENADAVLFVDLNELNLSAFNQEAEKYTEDTNEQLPPEVQKFMDTLEADLGITEDNMLNFAFSVSGIQDAYTEQSMLNLSFTAALSVNKPVTTEQLKSLIETYAEEEDMLKNIKEENYEGTTLFIASDPDGVDPDLSMTVVTGDESLFIFGDTASVKAVISRASTGEIASNAPVKAAEVAQLTDKTGWLSVVFPQAIRDEFDTLKGSPQAAMFLGPAAPSLLSMTKLSGAYEATDTLGIDLVTVLATPEDSAKVKEFIDNTVGGMGRAMSQQHLGSVPSLVSSLTATEEGNSLRIQTIMTVDDVKLFNDISEQ